MDLASIDLKSEHKYFMYFYYFGASTDLKKVKKDLTRRDHSEMKHEFRDDKAFEELKVIPLLNT
jgi:hypothetical protein